jgi:hypothetical protein
MSTVAVGRLPMQAISHPSSLVPRLNRGTKWRAAQPRRASDVAHLLARRAQCGKTARISPTGSYTSAAGLFVRRGLCGFRPASSIVENGHGQRKTASN